MSHTTHFDDCGCLRERLEARIAELAQRERESDKLHSVQVARVEILIGEKAAQAERIATLEAELAFLRDLPLDALKKQLEEMEEVSALNVRMGDILTLTVNALKGEPDSRSLHDWATLPEVARTLVAELAASREDAKLAWAEAAMGPTEAAITHELAQSQAHANALRDALEKADAAFNAWARDEDGIHPEAWPAVEHLREVLKATPAASLAAHRKSVLEKAATCAESYLWNLPALQSQVGANCGDAIRALAAQEVKRNA